MSLPAHTKQTYTYADYLSWPKDERWEIIGGVAYNMTPAPSRRHQEISGALFNVLYNYLRDKSCKVYTAPFDVRLPEGNESDAEIKNVVQPDIVVVCDKAKLDDQGCKGAPDFIAEIISAHTARKDVREKFYLYEKAGVKEYWIVHPNDRTVLTFSLGTDGKYGIPEMFGPDDEIPVNVLPGLVIKLNDIFRE
ncbi:Uma2 family endonuclease [Sporolituus thermophilus]|uniref:Endonuclease, Uma2 family (Restriction endonuclease fold) n=1 Tax=Sporolituus thermophilus DSM 23256 TaxID=1123285 RepID=A0A1G7P328_9FIRM|nr:Uma2 family endonuclease [Sporolituus thermophilus]SDF80708.1 Endonuclease, Uma2 family (restriction endonuclease fold) [Sporolituus thermophilus DSM 23256]